MVSVLKSLDLKILIFFLFERISLCFHGRINKITPSFNIPLPSATSFGKGLTYAVSEQNLPRGELVVCGSFKLCIDLCIIILSAKSILKRLIFCPKRKE